MANVESQGGTEGDQRFFYIEIDGHIHAIKTKSLEDAQQILFESGIEAPILEQYPQEDGAFLSRGCAGQLNLGLQPVPIHGSAEMLAGHKKLHETVPNFHPSDEVIMIGKLSVAISDGSHSVQTETFWDQPALFKGVVSSLGSRLEPVPGLMPNTEIEIRVA